MRFDRVTIPVGLTFWALATFGRPALADYDYDKDERDSRGGGGEDCRDARGPCEDNDASPSFQDSPVDRSFNPRVLICLPLSSCDFDDDDEATGDPV